MFIEELVAKERVQFYEEFSSWEEAIMASFKPLLADGSITGAYVDSVIHCVTKYGPYIVFAPDIAMPHAQENAEGVRQNAISFMKVEKPVEFEKGNREKDARLFFSLASANHDIHLENMQKLAEILLKDGVIAALLEAHDADDLLAIEKRFF
jgi:ascorbate PTS system EIIA or EIIAB component